MEAPAKRFMKRTRRRVGDTPPTNDPNKSIDNESESDAVVEKNKSSHATPYTEAPSRIQRRVPLHKPKDQEERSEAISSPASAISNAKLTTWIGQLISIVLGSRVEGLEELLTDILTSLRELIHHG